MSTDVTAAVVAIGLGLAVVVAGWHRNLGERTRASLPRFEGTSKQGATTPWLRPYVGGWERRERHSPWQSRVLAGMYLLLSLLNLDQAVRQAGDRALHWVIGGTFAATAVIFAVRSRRSAPS